MTFTGNNGPPLFGLVLAGGRSRRMKQDKALLQYGGRTQAEATFALVAARTVSTFLSCRQDQWPEGTFDAFPRIHDTIVDAGPMAGILSAFEQHPDHAWLVVACDLPFLDAETLDALVRERDPSAPATAYRSAHGGLPEPLCAVYEPSARAILLDFLGKGIRCPRKVMINSPVKLLDLANPRALDNINHPEEFEEARRQIGLKDKT